MNKKIAIPAIIAVAGAVLYYIQILGSENTLFERFPDVDPKVVVKAHRKMVLRSFAGQYNDITADGDFDRIFLDIVKEITK